MDSTLRSLLDTIMTPETMKQLEEVAVQRANETLDGIIATATKDLANTPKGRGEQIVDLGYLLNKTMSTEQLSMCLSAAMFRLIDTQRGS